MKVIAVIPCYNEEKTIGQIVKALIPLVSQVIVSDDHSTDGTAKVAKKAGAHVTINPGVRGTGSNTRNGIEQAKVLHPDIIVTLDGDGQHSPDDLPNLVKPITEGKADIVIGSRLFSIMPRYRSLGNTIILWLYNIGHKIKIPDAQSGFRAYSKLAADILKIEERGFGFSTETIIKARQAELRIVWVPVQTTYTDDCHSQNLIIHGLSVAYKTIWWRLKIKLLGNRK